MKSIEDGGQTQIEDTIECKHMNMHDKYDIELFILTNRNTPTGALT